jgi:hypothetical protein
MVISSVVTVPDRTDDFIEVLDGLLQSTILPDFLYVSICKFYPRLGKSFDEENIFKIKSKLENYPIKNRIVFYDIDIGPCLKLLTPIQEHKLTDSDQILIFDDDNGLFPTALECMMNTGLKCGFNQVYGIMGVSSGNFVHGEYINGGDYYHVDVLGGYRGVLYPVKVLNFEDLRNWVTMFINGYENHNMIAMHDDHIFSHFLKHKGIERRVVNVYPKNGLNYWPRSNNNGIFQDSELEKSLKILDEILINNNISI